MGGQSGSGSGSRWSPGHASELHAVSAAFGTVLCATLQAEDETKLHMTQGYIEGVQLHVA